MRSSSRVAAWSILCAVLCGSWLSLAGCQPADHAETSGITSSPTAPSPSEAEKEASPAPGKAATATRLEPHVANPSVPQEMSPFRFAEVAREAGIDFTHFSGMTEAKHYPTANGSGVAIFDYDGNGWMDVYFATCTMLPLGTKEEGPNRLYRNLGDGKFEDVTESSGLGFRGFCHGVVAADFDDDGDQDVFLACYGPNRLYRNEGGGKFSDVSAEAGVENMSRTVTESVTGADGKPAETTRTIINWASGGAPIDYDNDGDLDLYVAIHGDWRLPEDDKFCGYEETNIRLYCSPKTIRTVKHLLLRNEGGLKFTDATDAAGVGRPDGHGFGVVVLDVNADARPDIYVANDQCPNFLFLNKGDGTFEDATESSGAAFDIDGGAQSGMGTDGDDIDGDGLPELIVTNFQNEYNTLYRNNGAGFFTDMSPLYGLAQDSRPWTGWGCGLADFDLDGWPDFFVTNGYVDDNHPHITGDEPPTLHRNVSLGGDPLTRRFKIATRGVGAYFDSRHSGRGVAFGDLDNDGDTDIVINHKGKTPALLRNDTPRGTNHWLRLDLRGTRSSREAIGAAIEVKAGRLTIHRQQKGGGSMLSTNDRRVLIGVGDASKVDRLTVKWPSGAETVLEGVAVDETLALEEPAKD